MLEKVKDFELDQETTDIIVGATVVTLAVIGIAVIAVKIGKSLNK